MGNRPVKWVSWGDAARFANWLTNGQPTGPQGLSTTEDGSYYLNGATSDADLLAVTRKATARHVIPNEDEWYKAAYHKNDGPTGNYFNHPTGSDTLPTAEAPPGGTNSANFNHILEQPTDVGAYTGSPSPYGTFDQGGNFWEYNESVLNGSARCHRGGSYGSYEDLGAGYRAAHAPPTYESLSIGFRIAEVVPVPSSIVVDGCDTGVTNQTLASGRNMSDEIAAAAGDAKNHGQFVNAVAHLTNAWQKAGLISGAEKGCIQECASQASIPAPLADLTPPTTSGDSWATDSAPASAPEADNAPSVGLKTIAPERVACGTGLVECGMLSLTGLLLLSRGIARSRP
jgi:hypothetical protein